MSTETTGNDQPPPRTPLEQARHRHKTMQVARMGTAVIGMVAGTLLVARGAVLIGLLIGAMAALRLVMFLVAGRQRRQWERDRQPGWAEPGVSGRGRRGSAATTPGRGRTSRRA
jgi:hypothetical protein